VPLKAFDLDSLSQFLSWKRNQRCHYTGPSQGSKLIKFDPMTGARDPDIVDIEGDDDFYGDY
jgi:hypothetical protein